MSTGHSLLTSRHAELADMVALLRRQHDAKLAVIVPARGMRMRDGDLHMDGIGEPVLTPDGVTPARGVFRPSLTCDGGLADKLGFPSQCLRRMRETHVELLDRNVNTWPADEPAKCYLVGPRPPVGDEAHRYFFRLYALDRALQLGAGCSAADLRAALGGHELATGTLVGLFQR